MFERLHLFTADDWAARRETDMVKQNDNLSKATGKPSIKGSVDPGDLDTQHPFTVGEDGRESVTVLRNPIDHDIDEDEDSGKTGTNVEE